MTFVPGRYRLVYTDDLRRWFEDRLRANLTDPAELARELAMADAEAAVAELEITASGGLVSRAGDREWYRTTIQLEADRVLITKPTGEHLELEQHEHDQIVGVEVGKPVMKFVRTVV